MPLDVVSRTFTYMAANAITSCQAWPVPDLAIFFSSLCMSTVLADSITFYRLSRRNFDEDVFHAFLSVVKFFPFFFPVLHFLENCFTVCERQTAYEAGICNELWWNQHNEIEFSDSQLFKIVLVFATSLATCMWLANRSIWSIAPFLPLWILAGLGFSNIFSFVFHQMLKTFSSMSETFLNLTSRMLDPYESRYFAFSYRLFVVLLTIFKMIQTLSNLLTSQFLLLQMQSGIFVMSCYMIGIFIFVLFGYLLLMFLNHDISFLEIFAPCYASWIAHLLTDRELFVHIWEKGHIILVPSVVIFIFFICSSLYHLRKEARILYLGSAVLLLWYHMQNWLKRKAYWHEKAGELYESRGYHEKAIAAYTVAGNYYFIDAQNVNAAKKCHLRSSQQRRCFDCEAAVVMYSRIAKMHVKDQHYQDAAIFFIKKGNVFRLNGLCDEDAASCYWNAAEAYRSAKEYSQAADLFIKSSELYGCKGKVAECYREIGECYALVQQIDKANGWFKKAGDKYAEVGQERNSAREEAAEMYIKVAEYYRSQDGKLGKSLVWYERSATLYEAGEFFQKAALAYDQIATIHYDELADLKTALMWHLKSGEVYERLNLDNTIGEYCYGVAQKYWTGQQYQGAAVLYVKAGDYFGKERRQLDAAISYQNAAFCMEKLEEYVQAAELYIKSSELYGCKIEVAECFRETAECYEHVQQIDKANGWFKKAGDKYAEVGQERNSAHEQAANMYIKVAEYYRSKDGKVGKAFAWYERSAKLYEAGEYFLKASQAYYQIATIHYDKLEDFKTALTWHLKSVEVYERLNLDSTLAEHFHGVARKYWTDQQYEGAAVIYKKAGEFLEKANRLADAAICYWSAAVCMDKLEAHVLAAQLYIKSSKLFACKLDVAQCYWKTAESYAHAKQFDGSVEWFKKAGDMYADVGMETNSALEKAANMYMKVAEYYRSKDGQVGKAFVWYERSAKLYEAGEYFLKAALAYDQIATIHYDKLADFKTALTWHLKSVKAYERLNHDCTPGEHFYGIAQKYWTAQQYQGAALLYEKAGDFFEKASRLADASISHWNAADCMEKLKEYVLAAKLYIKSSELCSCDDLAAKCFWKTAECYALAKQFDRAAEWYERAGEVNMEVGQEVNARSYFKKAAKIFISLGKQSFDGNEAIAFFRKGADIYSRLNSPEDASQCYALIGEKYLEFLKQEKAAEYFYQAGRGYDECEMWDSAILYYTQATSLYIALENSFSVDRNDESCARFESRIVATTVSKFNVHIRRRQSYLLELDRQSVISELLNNILLNSRNPANTLHESAISVQFKDEMAAGPGVLVEFFSWIASVLVKGRDEEKANDVKEELYFILSESQHVYFPSPTRVTEADLDCFEAVGVILALAVHMKQQVPIPFARVVLKGMVKADEEFVFTLDDIKDCDPVLYKSLIDLLHSDIGSGETMDYEWHGKQVGDGSFKMVTNENKDEFVNDVLFEIWRDKELQMKRMGKGFQRIINKEILNVLTPVSLGMLLIGEQNIDVEEWKKVTNLTGFCKEDPIIQWFWEIVEAMTQGERLALLQFWSARRVLPQGGFSALDQALFIARSENEIELLPTALTCSSTLRIPEYTSKEMLTDRLSVILCHFEGFGFV